MFANKIHEEAEKALKEGKIEESIVLYTKALEENPNHIDILSDRGVAYLNLSKEKECFEDLNKALELQPDYAYRYACLAFAKKHFGDLDGAIIDYEKAIELDPEDTIAHNNLGLLLEQKGYQKKAQERFDRADKLSKQEDGLLNVIEELDDKKPSIEKPIEQEPEEPLTEDDKSKAKEFKKIFSSMKQFNEFMAFLKNGFKIK